MGIFGDHNRGSMGSILNALHKWGVPLNIVESVTVENGRIEYEGEFFARYKFFDGIEQPLFYFQSATYNNLSHKVALDENGDSVSSFALVLSPHGTPGMVSRSRVPGLYYFLQRTLTNYMDDPWYKVHKDAGAFFQGGSDAPDGDWYYIEFWKPQGAQAYVDKVNAELSPWISQRRFQY